MPASAKFWDKIAAKYAARPVADEAAYQRKLAMTRELLRPNMEVLEIGCGTGSTAIIHAPHVAHIRAVDISEKMIEIAKAKADEAGISNIDFEAAEFDELAVPNDSVDVVLALSFLHLVEDKQAVIGRIHRMLKPGGLFVSSTACLGDSMAWIKYIVPIGQLFGQMPMVKVFTTEQLKTAIQTAGFAIEEAWQPGKGKSLFLIARKADQASGSAR